MVNLPAELVYGKVVGRFLLAVGDLDDVDNLPDAIPAQGSITIIPKGSNIKVSEPALVIKQKIVCTTNDQGYLIDPQGNVGVWLVSGIYIVTYALSNASISSHEIEVLPSHTNLAPLNLINSIPPGGAVLTVTEYAELTSRLDALGNIQAGVSADANNIAVLGTDGKTFVPPQSSNSLVDATAVGKSIITAATSTVARTALGAAASVHTHTASQIADLPSALVPGLILPPIGSWIGGYGITAVTTNSSAFYDSTGVQIGTTNYSPLRVLIPGALTVDQVGVWVDTAQAATNAKILIYSLAADGMTPTLLAASPVVSLAVTGARTVALTAPLVFTKAQEILVAVICSVTAPTVRLRGVTQTAYVQINSGLTGLTATGNTFELTAVGTYTTPATNPTVAFNGGRWNYDQRAMVGLRRSA